MKPMSLNDPFVTLTQNEKQLLESLIMDEDILKTFYDTIKKLGLRICYEYMGFILAYYFRGDPNKTKMMRTFGISLNWRTT
jgi:hypothetical protein